MVERWCALFGVGLLLVGACTKTGPVELRTHELPGCGPVAELTEVGGRVIGVSDHPPPPDGSPPVSACAFDLDTQLGDLRLDRLTWDDQPIVGGNTQVVDGDGVQTVVGTWFTNENRTMNVGILRRSAAGLEQLDRIALNESSIPRGELDAERVADHILVAFTRDVHNAWCGESYDAPESHRIWRVGDEPAIGEGTAERVAIVGDDLLVAGVVPAKRGFLREGEIHVRRIASVGESEPRWVAQLSPLDGEIRPEDVLDLEVVGGSIYVLSEGRDRIFLSRMAADTGAVAWSLTGDGRFGELRPTSTGVQVSTLVRTTAEYELRRFEVDETGEVGPTRTTAVAVGSEVVISTLALGEGGRVWLGGYVDPSGEDWSTGWIGVVTIEPDGQP